MHTTNGLNIQENVELSDYSTMGVRAKASNFILLEKVESIPQIIEFASSINSDFLILGSGSNILFTRDFDGVVIKNELLGIQKIRETKDEIVLKIGAGESWHSIVEYCVLNEWYGIENLALIPGTVGAAPIQNIGAYGAELVDVFLELEAFDISTHTIKIFEKRTCKFGYRDSIFKNELKSKVIITSVSLKLQKNGEVNAEYGALKSILNEKKINSPSIHDIFEAVIEVRRSKLPDPVEIGNNGSFFKNPIIPAIHFGELKQVYPKIPSYPITEHLVKVPAGWLIDNAGWKGYRKGDAGVHEKQALVIVNYGSASGLDIYNLSEMIQQDVMDKYGITLEREVNIIPS